jgi:hypothetical protein
MYKNYHLTAVLALGLMMAPLTGLVEANQIDYVSKPVYNHNGEIIGSTRGVDSVISRQCDHILKPGFNPKISTT